YCESPLNLERCLEYLRRSGRYDVDKMEDCAYGSTEIRRILKHGYFVKDFAVFRRMPAGIVQNLWRLPRFEMNMLRVLDLCPPTVYHDNNIRLKMTDLLTLQKNYPSSLETLRFTLRGGSLVLPTAFMDASRIKSPEEEVYYKHYPGHDSNCDACVNPWRSIKTLAIFIDPHGTHAGELPLLTAYIMLKFLDLRELEVQTSYKSYVRLSGSPNIDDDNPWRNLVDPADHLLLQQLHTLKLDHPYASLIFFALHEFMDMGFTSQYSGTMPLRNLNVTAHDGFCNMFYLCFFVYYSNLRSLLIQSYLMDDSHYICTWEERYLFHTREPRPSYASLTHVHFDYGFNSDAMVMVSERCANLKILSLEWAGWRALPDNNHGEEIEEAFRLSASLRRLQAYSRREDKLGWIPFMYSTRLEQIHVDTRLFFSNAPFIVYVQIPRLRNHREKSRNKTPGALSLLAWYHDENHQAHLVPNPALVLNRLSRNEDFDRKSNDSNVKAQAYASTHDIMVIFAPSVPHRFLLDGKELPL
ncbi:hypothetical protein BC940DRAFT_313915, partial [Gongronella butleri]